MKSMLTIMAAALLAIATAGPAFAQIGQYDADFNNYLSHHPNEAAQIRANPRLIDNPTYIKNHPGLNQYLDNHPNVRKTIRAQSNGGMMHGEAMRGPGPGAYAGRGPGDYDSNHVWRDQGWWQKNHPDVWAKRHPNR
jgi:hypothetical protein